MALIAVAFARRVTPTRLFDNAAPAPSAKRGPWGHIGWRTGVELGVAIATGFLLVGFVVGLIYGLLFR